MKKHVVEEMRAAGWQREPAEDAFEQVSAAIARVVKRGDRVRLPGIGTLVRKTRAETRRRNPRTGEPITIASREVAALHKPEKF